MTKISDLHRRWSKDVDYREAYDALGEEFDLARPPPPSFGAAIGPLRLQSDSDLLRPPGV
jgi:hypothetical protein